MEALFPRNPLVSDLRIHEGFYADPPQAGTVTFVPHIYLVEPGT